MNKRKVEENVNDLSEVPKQAKIHEELTPERGAMKFDFMTSLQNIVMAKIVHNLWMKKSMLKDIKKFIHSGIKPALRESSDDWYELENIIVAELSQFNLSPSISSKLTCIVQAVGRSILQWIRHLDEYILNTTEYSKSSFVDLIGNIKWTVRGRIHYAQTARSILADRNICEDYKFKLACTYCLLDEIMLLASNVVSGYYLDNVAFDINPMVYYWTTHVTGDNITSYHMLCLDYIAQCRNMSINEYIFKILIGNDDKTERIFNEVAITYMWNKFSSEEKDKNIASLIKKLGNLDFKYTLLTSLEYEQQQSILKECSYSILVGILKDWLWKDYFLPTTLHILDVMNPLDFLRILKEEIMSKIKNSQNENKFIYNQYKSIFKKLWQKCPRRLKDFVFEHNKGCFLRDFLISLSCEQNMDIIGLILNDLNTKQRKNAISGFHGAECCSLLIQNDMWDFVKLFITPSLFSEDDIIQLKKKLVKQEGHWTAVHFLKQNARDKIEHFMSWTFKSQEEIDQFRQSLAHAVICEATLESIITHNKADFTELENHFHWCATGDQKVINEFKAGVTKLFHVKLFRRLIENNHYDLLEEVLNWCFLNDQQKIEQFKSNMYKDDNLARCIKLITIDSIKKDDSFTLLEKFLDWCFTDDQEVNEFKTWLLYPVGDLPCVCAELIFQNDLEPADKFLNWCIASSEGVCIYKNTLMFSNSDMKYILKSACELRQEDLQLLIKWFNPSKVTLQEFHTLYLEREGAVPIDKLKILSEIIESLIKLKENEEAGL